jgi:myo-inositol 2-dehydrogenase/D-chiro-inositol 1-dehydrogenase
MDKVKVGFVGSGWMGGVQMQRICERDDAEIVALLEPNKERGEQTLKDLGLSPDLLVDDYNKIIENPDVDAVWLVSPNSFHGHQSIAALEADKHVFCEKPCATDFEDFCRQIEIAKERPKLKTFVDYILLFDKMEEHLKNMAAQGTFGRITQIQVNYRHPVNIAGDKVWKLKEEIMGDAIGMGIVHAVSGIMNIMESQSKPVAVYATSQNPGVRGFEADPLFNILMRFEDGATGFCFGNIDSGNGYDAYHNIFGTQGGFVFESQTDRAHKVHYWSKDIADGKWIWPLDQKRCKEEGIPDLAWSEDTSTPDSGDVIEHQTGAVVDHFLNCIKEDKQSFLSFENSRTIAEIGWAAQISAKLNREISLPLDWDFARKHLSS